MGFGAARSVATGGAPGFPAFASAPGVQANPTTAIALAQEGYQRGLEKFRGFGAALNPERQGLRV